MSLIFEIVLCWFYPVYWELTLRYNTREEIHHFVTYRDVAIVRDNLIKTDSELVFWSIDKYINCRPNFLIKVLRHHEAAFL